MWVGRDRFAQFQKYFASVGLDAPWVADAGLVVAAALEVFALVFCAGAWLHFRKSRPAQTRSWFFVGVLLTLGTFTFFSVGDHWFGDRFELLEHTLFWFIAAVSWVVFVRLEHVALPSIPQRIPGGAVAVGAALLLSIQRVSLSPFPIVCRLAFETVAPALCPWVSAFTFITVHVEHYPILFHVEQVQSC